MMMMLSRALSRPTVLKRQLVSQGPRCFSTLLSYSLPLHHSQTQKNVNRIVPSLQLSRSFSSRPPPGGGPGGMNIFGQQPKATGETLKEYTIDLTELAASSQKNQTMDPIIGRHEEIRRCIQILSRRTKNCPVLIGAAG